MAFYVRRSRRDEVRIGRGLPCGPMTNQIVCQNFSRPRFRVNFFLLTNNPNIRLGTISLGDGDYLHIV